MDSNTGFSPNFVEGFVRGCMERGLDANQTEELFRKQANNTLLSQPAIQDGLRTGLRKVAGRMSKVAMVRAMHPDLLSLAVDCRVHYGNDPMSQQMRKQAGLPEPSWDNVPDHVKEAAANLQQTLNGFSSMPLNQQVMLAMMLGGGAGGALRAISPTNDDIASGRGTISRVARGIGHGATVGAGAATGARAGDFIGSAGGDKSFRLPMMLAGGLAGSYAGNNLANSV